ncbi:MAG: DEAD/DEAH box helicase family protein [Lachnospiraceae bacterium]|nr:DEAD/DEAH box helicase family protein [Lachnospiraceae bacterium]
MHTNVEKSKVAKAIGEEYKNWGHKDCIFIDAPTGSGKTTFILEILLPFLCHKNEKLLYLVNRRILKKQLEDTILNLPYEQRRAIRVELYQTVETRICNIEFDENKREYISKGYIGVEKFAEYDCVVCDECHYFITDSNYNTNTICSYRWVQDTFENKLSIFMSATINEIQSYIEKNNVCGNNDLHTLCYNIRCSDKYDLLLHSKHEYLKKEIKLYKIDRDYDYIDVKIIQSRTDIVDIVTEERDKWLIFVDKIKFGKELRNAIKKKFLKLGEGDKNIDSKVIMISSGYKHDKEGKEEVDRIIQSCAQSSQVLIATSVLDNGVNIKDIELRNIIVIADTKTTFIQMLGRKREDTQRLQLYIYKYNKNHFCKRRKQIERRKKIADVYLDNIENKIRNLCKLDYTESWSDDINRDYANKFEEEWIKNQSKKIMHDIATNNKKYNDIRSIFNFYDGTLYLNLLAFQNIENLSIYYNKCLLYSCDAADD